MPDCSQFAQGSRQLQICEGQSELSLRKVNAFRAMFGIEPFADDIEDVLLNNTDKVVSQMSANPGARKLIGGCCGGGSDQPVQALAPMGRMVEGTGVGGRLIEMFSAAGFESCPACYELAHQMNKWGPDGCRMNLELIVADILPRALIWEAEKLGWWANLMPEAVTEVAIKVMVEQAIATAKPLEFIDAQMELGVTMTPNQSRQPTRRDARQFVTRPGPIATPTGPPIETVDLTNAVRHITFHIWPVAGFSAWQWNCDRLIEVANLFNGRRIVAIATDETTDSAGDVRRYLEDFTDEFIELPNDSSLREVASWLPMLKRLESSNGPNDVTFSCHAKCVRHKLTPDIEGSTIFPWTKAMWQTCSNWEAVRPLLETKATVGSFRKLSAHTHALSFGEWHFSGTFYWWRNRDVFRRGWQKILKTFFGTEAWPGLLFAKDEAGVIVCDDVKDLYVAEYWRNEIEPQLAVWMAEHGKN